MREVHILVVFLLLLLSHHQYTLAQVPESSSVSVSVSVVYLNQSITTERKGYFPHPQLSHNGKHIEVDVRLKWSLGEQILSEPNKYYDWALMYSCRSFHDTGNRPNLFNEVNPCLGIVKYFDIKMLGIRPYFLYLHVFENSRDGKMKVRGVGGETCPISGPYFDTCVGLTYAWVGYEDGWRGISAHRKLKIPHLALQKDRDAIVFQPLGGDDFAIHFRRKF